MIPFAKKKSQKKLPEVPELGAVVSTNMADNGAGLIEQLKSCIVWCWAYFWTVWFFVMLFLVNILRLPFRYNDSNAGEVSVNNSFSVSQACKLQKLLVGRPVKTTRHVYVVGLAQLAS